MFIWKQKTVATLVLIITISLLIPIGCGGGSTGGDENDNAVTGNEFISNLKPARVLSQSSKVIDASTGGTIEHAGATLIIPPNALAESISLSLAKTDLPSKSLLENDEILLGRKVITEYGFVITSDKDIRLNGVLTLRIPIDLTQVSETAQESDIEISTDTLGHLIPQGAPSKLNLAEGFVEMEFTSAYIFMKTNNQILGRPQGYLVPFALFAAGIFIETYNTLTVTWNTPNTDTHRKLTSEHFNLYSNPVDVSDNDAIDIIEQLEKAHELFVDGLGFSNRKNLINYDGRYTVIIARLKGGEDAPDGYTLPGSSLFEGGSYINLLSVDKQKIVAVHEYFHNLQHGALTSYIIPNMGEKGIDLALGMLTDATSQWLFEGSAAALAGRVVFGNSISPARDTGMYNGLKDSLSLYDFNQDPAPDVAQDFFFFLERRLGNADFYLPTFNALRRDLFDTQERAVRALDETLKNMTGDDLDIELAWEEFTKDYFIDNSHLYNSGNITSTIITATDGSSKEASINLPPLSYTRVWFKVPKLEKDSNGNILPNQLRDLVIELKLTSNIGYGTLNIEFVDELNSTASIRESATVFASDSTPKTYTFANFRGESNRDFYAVISNSDSSSETFNSLTKNLYISAGLKVAPAINGEVRFYNNGSETPTENDYIAPVLVTQTSGFKFYTTSLCADIVNDENAYAAPCMIIQASGDGIESGNSIDLDLRLSRLLTPGTYSFHTELFRGDWASISIVTEDNVDDRYSEAWGGTRYTNASITISEFGTTSGSHIKGSIDANLQGGINEKGYIYGRYTGSFDLTVP